MSWVQKAINENARVKLEYGTKALPPIYHFYFATYTKSFRASCNEALDNIKGILVQNGYRCIDSSADNTHYPQDYLYAAFAKPDLFETA